MYLRLTFHHWLLVAGLSLGLAIRLAVAPHGGHPSDMDAFATWLLHLHDAPLEEFYALEARVPPNHLPGTIWLLYVLGLIVFAVESDPDVSHADLRPYLKAVPIAADLVNAFLLWIIGRRLAGSGAGLLAAWGYLLAPGTILISAFWGQWDAVPLVFVLVALRLGLDRRLALALPALAIAVLMKPQFILIAPEIVLFACLADHPPGDLVRPFRTCMHSARQCLRGTAIGGVLSVLLVAVASWPLDVSLVPMGMRWTIWDRLREAAGGADGVTLGGLGIWMIPVGAGAPPGDGSRIAGLVPYAVVGTCLVICFLALALVLQVRTRGSAMGLIAVCALIYFAFGMVATRLHERYLFPALILLLLLSAVTRRFQVITVVCHCCFAANLYLAYAFHDSTVPLASLRTSPVLSSLAVVTVSAFVVFAIDLWRTAPEDWQPAA